MTAYLTSAQLDVYLGDEKARLLTAGLTPERYAQAIADLNDEVAGYVGARVLAAVPAAFVHGGLPKGSPSCPQNSNLPPWAAAFSAPQPTPNRPSKPCKFGAFAAISSKQLSWVRLLTRARACPFSKKASRTQPSDLPRFGRRASLPLPCRGAALCQQCSCVGEACLRWPNGERHHGDGYRYRGRGLKQLTGKANYIEYSLASGEDVIVHPNLLLMPGPRPIPPLGSGPRTDAAPSQTREIGPV